MTIYDNDDKTPLQKATEAGEACLSLLELGHLVDWTDPLFQKLHLAVVLYAQEHDKDFTTAVSNLSMGYIAGRLRGRKEAHMARILGEEVEET